jgi:hypothetical protein
MRLKRVGTAAFLLIWCACQPEGPAGGDVERTQLGDTLHVHSRAPIHSDTATLREVARIGLADGAQEQMLNRVSAFIELLDGSVAVADDAGLRRFTSDGRFAELIARRGEGPGEIDYITGMAVAPDGALLASDLGNRRINIYRADGSLDHVPMPAGMPGYGRNSIVVLVDGAIHVAFNPPLTTAEGTTMYPRPIFLRLGPGGIPSDTLFADSRLTRSCPALSSNAWRSGFYEDLREPYFPKVKWALAPTGVLALGCPATYSMDLVQTDGSILRISRDAEPVAVSGDERQAFVDAHTFSRNRSGFFESWTWEGAAPPDRRPAYDRMFFSQDGALWVWPAQRSARQEVPDQFVSQGAPRYSYTISMTGAFDVFASSGEYVGAVRLPEGLEYRPFPGHTDFFIRSDTVWAVAHDSLEVEYLAKYVVEWPVANGANGT